MQGVLMRFILVPAVLFLSLGLALDAPETASSPNAPSPRGPASTSTPILEQFDDSLTTYLPSGPTSGQDLSPQVGHRGINLDGSLRAAPVERMAIQGNPFERAWREKGITGMRLSLGGPEVQDVDIALPAEGFSWVIGRSYNAQQEAGSHRDSNGYQGQNWFQSSQMEIQLYTHPTDANRDVVYLYYGADRFAEYERVDVTPGPSDEFKGTNGAAGVFSYSAGSGSEPDLYTLTDQNGDTITFFGFDANAGAAAGQIWKISDPAGNTAYVGDASTASTAIASGYDGNGHITTAYDSSGRRYTYTYTLLDGVERLTRVLAEEGPSTWTTVAQVDYAYYGASESYGEPGDLKLVTITTPMSDSGITQTRRKYYRYWEGTYDASTNPGHVHALKYVVDFEGTRRQDYEDATFDQDYLSLSDAALAPYSSAYYEYDANHRVDLAWFNGECGCSGGVNGTHEFRYEVNPSYSDTTGYQSGWAARTVVKRPDASYLTQYYDETWQPLSRVITDDDPALTSPVPGTWVWRAKRNSSGAVTEIDMPSNIKTYTHSTGAITQKSGNGLVYLYTRSGSGATKGFVTKRRFKKGKLGTSSYYEAEWEWTQANLLVGDEYVVRPILDKRHEYQVQGTSTANRITTDYTTVVASGGLDLESVQTTDPVIPISMNGSGVATGETIYYRRDGTVSFRKARDGVISYTEFSNNQVAKRIEDVDTSQTSDFDVSVPAGLSSAPGALHRITTMAYDAQGRVSTTTEPDGHVLANYYSRLADEREVTLGYADFETSPSTKYFGPVRYVVRNHAGKADATATVALTGNESTLAQSSHIDETDADPITAVGLGSVVRLSTSRYNETGGYLLESRLYFDVPASGEGLDGTNFDPTFYGYDDLGRRERVKEPTGTIHRTSYTIHGEVADRWMGTNDSSFHGGEASGTDSMVKTESLIYDGNADGGDRYLTKRKVFIEDGTSGQRVTTYKYDLRGRLLLETGPLAPHAFTAYDNQGRVLATGLYSSTASIHVNTDSPTTLAANRMALTESAYDPMGRLWKTTRHNIDPADGSDDDSVTSELWRDEVGRVVKEQGVELAKSTYDSLGRRTHRFTLAKVDDTSYADALDVTGDHVLEESQSVYDDLTDEVLLSVLIQRKHDDWGAGETTGALDTNADGDPLKVTASDIKGRAQINASWYDRFHRATDQVAYGTYGGATFDRTGLSVPARSDTALVTSYAYDTAGELQDTTDPRALIARTVYDDAGREIQVIRNYEDGIPSGTDSDQTVRYEYTDGLRTKIIADMPAGTADQTTIYSYGTTKGTSAGDSKVATGHLLHTVQYPDSTGAPDVVTHAYDAQGEEIWKQDQAGNVTETDYDTMGRVVETRLTTIDVDFDSAVARIGRTYDSLGRPDRVTQYDSATVGSGSVIDEVQYGYDGWGNVTSFAQDRDSTVGGGSGVSEYTVSYTFAKATGGRRTVRRSSMTLPSGNVITFDYTADQDDAASRVSALVDGATTLARYRYLGGRFIAGADYEEPGVYSRLYDATGYAYLDRFNRTTKSAWTSDLATPVHFYDVDIAYDRNSNITLTQDHVHSGFDVAYTMDGLDRLVEA
ncbi:MAG TPA: hypothetical protein ENJ09_03925, partial [Planctomycetes bacterium]|nr:hypothetical protein [Planctomycetota bacterium]